MKALILSCNTGGGHNSAARAIAEEMQDRGDEAYVLDYLCLAGEAFPNWWETAMFRL